MLICLTGRPEEEGKISIRGSDKEFEGCGEFVVRITKGTLDFSSISKLLLPVYHEKPSDSEVDMVKTT